MHPSVYVGKDSATRSFGRPGEFLRPSRTLDVCHRILMAVLVIAVSWQEIDMVGIGVMWMCVVRQQCHMDGGSVALCTSAVAMGNGRWCSPPR